MAKYELRLPDGTCITAIGSLTLKRLLNDAQDISLGSACAAMLEVTLYDAPAITAGTELTCYENGTALGIFLCEEPRRAGTRTTAITAYDRMILFDRDVGPWLDSLSYPTTAQAMLEGLCGHCGVALAADTALPQITVRAFRTQGTTGRRLLNWLGQAAGNYFAVNAQGFLEAGWYGREAAALEGCRMGTLTWADYTTAPIERVLIRGSETDVGTVWPDGSLDTANTYIIQGNPLLTAGQTADLRAAAQRLWELLQGYTCTPFSCTLLPGSSLAPGMTVRFTDAAGNTHTAPIMELTVQNGQRTVGATGCASLTAATAFNRAVLEALPERVLTVEQTAQGLRVENADTRGTAAALALSLEGITGRVAAVEEGTAELAPASAVSVLEQRADSLSLSLTELRTQTDAKADKTQLTELTEHFLFDEDGLTISNTATGMGIGVSQERVVFTGGDSPTTVITPNAMTTTNLQIGSRLDLGNFTLLPRSNQNLSLRCTAK